MCVEMAMAEMAMAMAEMGTAEKAMEMAMEMAMAMAMMDASQTVGGWPSARLRPHPPPSGTQCTSTGR